MLILKLCCLHGLRGGNSILVNLGQRHIAHGHVHSALKVLGNLFIGGFSLGAVGALVVGVQGHGRRTLLGGVEVVSNLVTLTNFGGGHFGGVTRGRSRTGCACLSPGASAAGSIARGSAAC